MIEIFSREKETDSLDPVHTKKIFITGYSRSGTTLLGRILGKNDDVFLLYELHFFEELFDPNNRTKSISSSTAIELTSELIARQRTGYFNPIVDNSMQIEAKSLVNQIPKPITPMRMFATFLDYETKLNGKYIPLEQTPRNVYFLENILTSYPQAFVVNIVRDSRDTVLSQKNKHKRFWTDPSVSKFQCIRFWANYHPITISLLWNSSINASLRYSNHPRTITIRFEDLVSTPIKIIKKVCSFVGIDYSEKMLNVSHIGSSHDPDNLSQLGIKKSVSQRWRHENNHQLDLAVCQYITRNNLVQYGYELAPHLQLKLWQTVYAMLTWPIKVLTALLSNISRTRNLVQSIRKRLS
ncbi:MAG: sulfotransferase [Anaerolineales bacterium]